MVMRVVIVSKTFVAETAQRQLEWIARQPDVHLTLVSPSQWRSDDGRVLPFLPRFTDGYTHRTLPVFFNGRYHMYLYRGLGDVLRELAPDVIHIDEEPYNAAGAHIQWHARARGIPTVFVAWQSRLRSYPPPFAQFERYDYQHTAHIIAGNAVAADVLRQKGYTGPLSTFSLHGVDPELYRPMAGTHANGRFVIGYIGRLVSYKGIDLLIDALARLPASSCLRLVGSGPDEASLRARAAARGVAGRVEFVGAVATPDVPGILAGMDVLALPSRTLPNWMEQFGRVLIEAMSCEVPVVGSDSGEIPAVIGDAGLIVPEGSVEALRDALLRLAEDIPLRQYYALRGRERVIERFTQEQVARKTLSVYHRVLSR